MSLLVKKFSSTSDLVDLFQKAGLAECLHENFSLAPFTSFRVGGVAEIFLAPRSCEEMAKAYQVCCQAGIVPRILGGGYNLLIVTSHIPVVISTRHLKGMTFTNGAIRVKAGTSLPLLIKRAIQRGYAGLESLVGIPGSVGGSIAGNAGSKPENIPVEIGQFVETVRVLDETGTIVELSKDQIEFSYRNSSLRPYLVLEALLHTVESSPDQLQARYQSFLEKKLASQPFNSKSAGCIFKNPPGKAAWKLIQEASLVGKSVGGAMVSSKHCNFIVNHDGANSQEIWELIQLVQAQVASCLGVHLAIEIKVWN